MSTTISTIGVHGPSAPFSVRKTPSLHDEVERLSAKFHLIQQEVAKRQGEERDETNYDDLEEGAKEIYRAQARYILDHYIRR
jgi:hypothetical protein